MFMPAILASVSLARSTESPVACCPKGIGYPTTRLIFGVQAVADLTTQLAARCSVAPEQPGWLPDPAMTGDNSLEEILADLKYVDSFMQSDLTSHQVSQILWAGYGCTPHVTSNSRAGLTVPSAYANYYLSKMACIATGTETGTETPEPETIDLSHQVLPTAVAGDGLAARARTRTLRMQGPVCNRS
jgi:hypothetical protein